MLDVQLAPASPGSESADVEVLLGSTSSGTGITVTVVDHSYGNAEQTKQVASGTRGSIRVSTAASHRWYDLSLRVPGAARFSVDSRAVLRMVPGDLATQNWLGVVAVSSRSIPEF